MSYADDDRRAELIAAALADELSPVERAELDALRAADPTIDRELAELRELASSLSPGLPALTPWLQAEPGADLRARIEGIAPASPSVEAGAGPSDRIARGARRRSGGRRSRSRFVGALVTAGAACLAVGLALGIVLPGALSAPPSGPPGTLGAIERIDVTGEPAGMLIDAELVAHTWGTEAVLDASGLDVGEVYSIVMLAEDGAEFSAGAMLGSEVPIHCRVNAAVLRESVVRVEIRDADDAAVAAADVPQV
ncbi:MAG: hypothetical protein Q7T17_15360 [Microbacterium sp.]|uniref:hypothetical protein n=1 Tax=Microbacterium sp. TaxID=51671 RepID=UPI002719FA5E|nr:hypothetical protein [Microbacterium sp.]MDO8384339.1 hypothetical protein [Microbacterium sp.]